MKAAGSCRRTEGVVSFSTNGLLGGRPSPTVCPLRPEVGADGEDGSTLWAQDAFEGR